MPSPQDVLSSTTPQIRQLISDILKIEKEYQQYQNLSKLKDKETELCDRIIRLLEQEIRS